MTDEQFKAIYGQLRWISGMLFMLLALLVGFAVRLWHLPL
jgi:hypothetical protein